MTVAAVKKKDLVPRFWFSLLFTVPLFLRAIEPWVQWALATLVLIVGAHSFILKGFSAKLNRYALISSGLALLYLYSLLELFFAKVPTLYFDQVAGVTTLLNLGYLMLDTIEGQSKLPLQQFLEREPKMARKLFYDGHTEDVPIEKVGKDDGIRVSPDEIVPVDGVIFSGYGVIDESLFSGNSKPVEKVFGQQVLAGTKNLKESFIVRTMNVGEGTLFAKCLKSLNEALATPEEAGDVRFIHVILGLSLLSLLLSMALTSFAAGISAASALLLIANPRAIFLAKSQPKDQAILSCASQGILISSRTILEQLKEVNMLVFGKRNILTGSNLSIVAIVEAPGTTEKELLATAASLEANSPHPLAEHIIERARLSGVLSDPATEEEHIPGLGVRGKVDNKVALIGDERLMEGIALDSLKERAEELRKSGYVVLFTAKDQKLLGLIAILDPFRAGTKEAIATLKCMGLTLFCLTGDRRITAVHAVNALGFDRFMAEADPTQKLATLKKLKAEGHKVAFFGDPVKNAAIFKNVDVSIANGPGSNLLGFIASVTLLRPGLQGVVRLFNVARRSAKIEEKNLLFANGYNILAIAIAFFVSVSPIIATVAMVLSSLVVAFRAMQLQK